jgi:predicted SnoaL-like aldol condensation-catalyzing enzyme
MNDPEQVVLAFNDCINTQDIAGLSALMTNDHTFIDSSNEVHQGKAMMVAGWTEFFHRYPDYRNHFTRLETRGNLVLVTGYSTCAYDPLDGPAIWTAKVETGRIAEWRVYLDTAENRARLNLSG